MAPRPRARAGDTEAERFVKTTYEDFPVNKLPEELRRGLQADGVVQVTIRRPEAVTAETSSLDAEDSEALASLAEQARRVEALCAQRKFW